MITFDYKAIIALFVLVIVELCIIVNLTTKIRDLKSRYKLKEYGINKRNKKLLRKSLIALDNIDKLDGIQFEGLCCEVLNRLGYKNIQTTATTGDFGVDIICEKDKKRIAIQCKCYNKSIGVDAVQQVYSGCRYYRCDVPVVMTNQYLTESAQELARDLGVKMWSRNFLIKTFQGFIKEDHL